MDRSLSSGESLVTRSKPGHLLPDRMQLTF